MKSIALMITLAVSTLSHAETWRYVDTINSGVVVYLDQDSIQPALHWSNRRVTIATVQPQDDAELLNLEVNCEHKTLRVNNEKWLVTQSTQHGGRLVRAICSQKIQHITNSRHAE
jgi:hypothetical protein